LPVPLYLIERTFAEDRSAPLTVRWFRDGRLMSVESAGDGAASGGALLLLGIYRLVISRRGGRPVLST